MMKKIILTIFLLLTVFMTKVNAETIFKYDWKTNSEYLQSDYTMQYNNNTYYDKGYVTTTINLEERDNNGIPKTYINKYNIEGNLVKTKTLENNMIISITSNSTNIIALSVTYDEEENYQILILDNELNITKEIPINLEQNEEISYIIEEFKILGIKYLNIIEDKLYFLTTDYIKEINLSTNKITNIDNTDNDFKRYMNHLYRLEEEQTDTKMYFGYDKNNKYEVLTGYDNKGCINYPVSEEVGGTLNDSIYSRYPIFTDSYLKQYVSCDPDYHAIIKIYDNNELLIDKTYDEYSMFSTPHIINNYIVSIATKIDYDTYNFNISLVIFDMNGNIIQEIKEEEFYISLVPGPSSFMTIGSNPSVNNKCYIEEKEISYNCFKNNNIVYYLPLKITTKIEGEGTIDVKEEARYEQLVKYYSLPSENYILENLTIVDSLNNEITHSNNTFTMPDNDVTIIAKFNVANPNTVDNIKATFIILFISIIGIIFVKKHKKNI